MAEPFLGQIAIFGFNFAPRQWAQCDGQILPISQYQALFSLLGTTYGGDGETTFALPDLRGRAAAHRGSHRIGNRRGEEDVTLQVSEIPSHRHAKATNKQAKSTTPEGKVLASRARRGVRAYSESGSQVLKSDTSVGGSQSHTNMQPFLIVNFCIALQGLFPSQD